MAKTAKPEGHTAFLFPGQGAQEVGMGKGLCKTSAAAHDVFRKADEILGFPLSDLMFNGPAKTLNLTVNVQPAILTMSLACLAAVNECLEIKVDYMAGHSLGEYTALAASGILEVGEAILLVQERGRLMQEACDKYPGTMAAILGMNEETLAEICRETCVQIANINAPGQIVISGTKKNIAKAIKLASKGRAKRAIPLKVSGAFHSYLMSTAMEGMFKAINKVTFRNAAVPVIANCSAKSITSAQEIKEELTQQLCGCVRWQDSISYMVDVGVTNFIEFGPGRVLTDMMRRIAPKVDVVNVDNADSVAALAAKSISQG